MGKIIGAVVVVVILIGAFFLWQKGKSEAPAMDTQKGMMDQMPEMTMKEESKGMVASIKDAMGLGQKMQCTYAMETDGKSIESTVMVDGERYQSTTMMGDMTMYALFDGETQYTWTSAAKTGMKMSKDCLEEMKTSMENMPKSNVPTTTPSDPEAAFDMAKNVSCIPVTGGATLSVPADVTFTDQCAMMKQSMDMMKQMQDKMPASMTMPSSGSPSPY